MAELLAVDTEALADELPQVEEHLAKFDNLPAEIKARLDELKSGLS
jgi:GTP-dependent phosphoenolpyruvate carboxykinase